MYYGKWRDSRGRQVKRKLGPAWLRQIREGRWVKRTGRVRDPQLDADGAKDRMWGLVAEHEAKLEREARRGEGDSTFGALAEDWLRHGQLKRGLKRSTLRDYRQVLDCYLLPELGSLDLDAMTTQRLEAWHSRYPRSRTAEKLLMVVRAILAYGVKRGLLDDNPAEAVERNPVRYSGDYDFYSREEVDALVRSAASDQDGAIYLTAALTGLRRGELLALRWRDVDFAGEAIRVRGNLSHGEIVTPKSGKVRVVPMIADIAACLARVGQREQYTRPDDPVFVGLHGGHVDPSALRRRYADAAKRAELRPLPFHSLRHHFGSMAVNVASLVQVQAWMGHAQIATTMRYLHHRAQTTDAALLASAFEPSAQLAAAAP